MFEKEQEGTPSEKRESKILYEVIARDIQRQIEEGTLKAGDRLPTEKSLCDQYDVSRVTVRKALDVLVKRNHLRKVTNQGVFVNSPKVKLGRSNMPGEPRQFMFHHLKEQGMNPSSKVWSMEMIPAGKIISNKLGCDPNAMVYRIVRIIYINGVSFQVQVIYMMEEYFPEFNLWLLQDDDLGTVVERDYHRKVGQVQMSYSVQSPPSELIELANWEEDKLLMYEEAIASFSTGEKYEYHTSYIDTSMAEYTFILTF